VLALTKGTRLRLSCNRLEGTTTPHCLTIDLWSWVFPSESEAFQVRVAHCFMYCTLATVFYFGGGLGRFLREKHWAIVVFLRTVRSTRPPHGKPRTAVQVPQHLPREWASKVFSLDKRKSSALMATSILPTSVSYLVPSLTMFRLCLQELTGLSGCTLFIGNRVRFQAVSCLIGRSAFSDHSCESI
jgi:hypothetical protein